MLYIFLPYPTVKWFSLMNSENPWWHTVAVRWFVLPLFCKARMSFLWDVYVCLCLCIQKIAWLNCTESILNRKTEWRVENQAKENMKYGNGAWHGLKGTAGDHNTLAREWQSMEVTTESPKNLPQWKDSIWAFVTKRTPVSKRQDFTWQPFIPTSSCPNHENQKQ